MAISRNEFSRRYFAIRKAMKEQDVECLIIYGRQDYFGRGNVRYVTNLGLGGAVVFFADSKPIFYLSAAQIKSPNHNTAGPIQEFIDFKESTDLLMQIPEELTRYDEKERIGIVGINEIPVPLYLKLQAMLGPRLVDMTNILYHLRIIKSTEEINKIRMSVSIADKTCLMLRNMVRPGLSDYEIYGAVKNAVYTMGCEYSMELIDAQGSAMNMAWGPIGNVLEDKGTLFLEITPAFEGYYGQLPVSLPVGSYSSDLAKMAAVWKEAADYAASLLKPGTAVAEVYKGAHDVIEQYGFVSPLPSGHAIGLDAIDYWTVNASNMTVLQPGMTLALHPCVLRQLGKEGIGMGSTYLITHDGAENLSGLDLYKLCTE